MSQPYTMIPIKLTKKQIKQIQAEQKRAMEREVLLFVKDNPTPLFIRAINLQKQASVEIAFSEQNVPNPKNLNYIV